MCHIQRVRVTTLNNISVSYTNINTSLTKIYILQYVSGVLYDVTLAEQ